MAQNPAAKPLNIRGLVNLPPPLFYTQNDGNINRVNFLFFTEKDCIPRLNMVLLDEEDKAEKHNRRETYLIFSLLTIFIQSF